MDKIYSRKRLLIPKFKKRNRRSSIRGTSFLGQNYNRKPGNVLSGIDGSDIGNFENNKLKNLFDRKLIKTAIIVVIAVFIANRIIATIEPTVDVLCIDMAKSIATKVSNEQASKVMEKYKYEDISNVVRDDQ